ncbi:protein ABIL4-like [Rhododendron vialii]|uniref:protein ABIL4-like n=1 Tax=Rhododendron vialii TaxID=182163 RepID=UPI00265F803F|nr:protein ABIL4-like [Rhododendron vialii]
MEDSSKSSENENPEAKLEDDPTRFSKSLQELKDLCSQLHYAADYCETSFVSADHAHKKSVVQNTKEYLCRAVVTVVDHLGSVSANLDYRLSNDCAFSETEFRINGLKQRLVACQQYSHQLGFTKVSWNASFPRYNPRYIFPPMVNRQISMELLRKGGSPVAAKTISKHEFVAEEEVPLFLYTSNRKPSLVKDSSTETDNQSSTSVLPVRDGLSALPKASNPLFHFESKPTKPAPSSSSTGVAPQEGQFPKFQRKPKRNTLNWKSVQNSDIATLIRKTKRAM